uniref:Putative secreted protein n=1 Tax=Ixodes ricinus TaxID=34613 RepID=A0A090XD03_IXORI
MLWLKLTLVILISEIGERTMCSESGPAPSTKENKNAPETLPQASLLNNMDRNGCNHQLLPYIKGGQVGFLTVNCTKSCPGEIKENDANGNPCVFKVKPAAKPGRVKVKEGFVATKRILHSWKYSSSLAPDRPRETKRGELIQRSNERGSVNKSR